VGQRTRTVRGRVPPPAGKYAGVGRTIGPYPRRKIDQLVGIDVICRNQRVFAVAGDLDATLAHAPPAFARWDSGVNSDISAIFSLQLFKESGEALGSASARQYNRRDESTSGIWSALLPSTGDGGMVRWHGHSKSNHVTPDRLTIGQKNVHHQGGIRAMDQIAKNNRLRQVASRVLPESALCRSPS
jgi:hypothetical protein